MTTPLSVRRRVAASCEAVVEAPWFALAGFAVILLNALLLGLETYDGVARSAGAELRLAEHLCIAGFVVELLVRFGARLDRPARFFRDGWNLFDLAVIVAPLIPGVRENVSVLRLVRLARLLRTFRLFPSLRVILVGIRHALPGLGSFLLITGLLIYGYAMLGWMMFGAAQPEKYGTVGQAMLTLFLLLSLDGITDMLQSGREVHPGAVFYYISYMVAACYLLTNLLVGLVLTALQEAHEAERASRPVPGSKHPGPRDVPAVLDAAPGTAVPLPPVTLDTGLQPLRTHLADLRASIDALELRLAHLDPAPPPLPGRQPAAPVAEFSGRDA